MKLMKLNLICCASAFSLTIAGLRDEMTALQGKQAPLEEMLATMRTTLESTK